MSQNSDWFARACKIIPGGVNSPVRAFRSVGGDPFFVERGAGCRLWDVDGKEYIDYVLSWGPLILGHAHPEVIRAVTEAARHAGVERESFYRLLRKHDVDRAAFRADSEEEDGS